MRDVKAFFDTTILMYLYGGAIRRNRPRRRNYSCAGGEYPGRPGVLRDDHSQARHGARRGGRIVRNLLNLPLVMVDADSILTALAIEERYRISFWEFWDALIVAAAEAGGAQVLYTEDLNDGQQYGQVVARNPFRE